ncbi:MAG: MFS transporter, partial [Proteobacteria bacterium]|nr:MFS transporter [Pseudomonadota bacterium]
MIVAEVKKRNSIPSIPVVAITCACIISLIAFGPRSAMGFFQLPMLQDTGWDRTTFAFAMALQNLCWGLGQPFFGAIADRYGTWRVLTVGAVLYISGLVTMAFAATPLWLYVGGGVLVGLGVAACSFGVILAALARLVSAEKRSFVFGLGTAAGSAGMFLYAPISKGLIDSLGWSDSLLVLSSIMLIIPVLAIALRGNTASSKIASAELEQSFAEALREAFAHKGYWLLTSGFFVCGFQVAFITAHFPAYISDLGLEVRWAVIAISLIGIDSILGSERYTFGFVYLLDGISFVPVMVGLFAILSGPVSDRIGRRRILLAGCGVMTVALASHGLVDSYWSFLAVRVFAGMAGGVLSGA